MSMPTTPEEIRHWIVWESYLGRRFPLAADNQPPPDWYREFDRLGQAGQLRMLEGGVAVRRPQPRETPAHQRAYKLILATLETVSPPQTRAGWDSLVARYGIAPDTFWDAAADLGEAGLITIGSDGRLRAQHQPPARQRALDLGQLGLKPVAPKTTPPTPPVIPPAKAMPTPPPVPLSPPSPPKPPREPVPPPAPETTGSTPPPAPETLADGIEFADAGATGATPEPPVETGSIPAPEAVKATRETTANPAPESTAGATGTTTETISNPAPEATGAAVGATEATPATASNPVPEAVPVPLDAASETTRTRAMGHLLRGLAEAGEPATASSVVAGRLTKAQRRVFPELLEAAVTAGAVRRLGRGRCMRYRLGDPTRVGFTPDTLQPTAAALTAC